MTRALAEASDPCCSFSERLTDLWGIRLSFFVAISVWFLGSWWTDPYSFGLGHDWTYFTQQATVAYDSLARYHELPAWNPFFCGGVPLLGNLQSEAVSPDFLLTLPFGLWVGLRLRFLLLLVLGLEGAYRYARHLQASGFGALAGAVCFAFSGRFVQLFYDGQPSFFGFELLPWVLWGFERGVKSRKFSLVGGAFLAWVFLHGGAVATPMVGVAVALVLLRELASVPFVPASERVVRLCGLAASALILSVSAAGFSMVRLLPVAESLLKFPRAWLGHEAYSLEQTLALMFAAPGPSGYADPGTAYVGLLAVALGLFALCLRDKSAWGQLVLLVVCVDLSMGEAGFLGSWNLLRALPVLHNLRNPFRFSVVSALFVAMAAARGVTLLETLGFKLQRSEIYAVLLRWLGPKALAVALLGISLSTGFGAAYATATDVAFQNRERLSRVARRPMSPRATGPFQQSLGDRWLAHVWPAVGLGTLSCFEEQPFPVSRALRADLPAEEYFADQEGRARRIAWSPHRIELQVTSKRGGVVVINQNAHRGFETDLGEMIAWRGLLAIRVPPGAHRLIVKFRDPLVSAGLALSLASVVAATWIFCRRPEWFG